MCLADFCRRGKRNFSIAFIHHNTIASENGLRLLTKWCSAYGIQFSHFRLEKDPPLGASREEFWREARYEYLKTFQRPILMGHHLDDVIETWIFTSIHGNPMLIPYHNLKMNIFRPFLLSRKSELVNWCVAKNVPFIEDSSNSDVTIPRNRIRHTIIPELLKINPGLPKVIRKKILKDSG